ncbi:hypothetical protein [uncultured Gammaproteobacteria bacterium]|nr:hypothetical protein [uncultured Gammaproteobacteria bacterium]CAC9595715.1 hypothetical protein [uncultured Gammaproteobacteria bacterium]CAC9953695.1 hypothetical protein [uncultured Gammaproteobacteria bacterium]
MFNFQCVYRKGRGQYRYKFIFAIFKEVEYLNNLLLTWAYSVF